MPMILVIGPLGNHANTAVFLVAAGDAKADGLVTLVLVPILTGLSGPLGV